MRAAGHAEQAYFSRLERVGGREKRQKAVRRRRRDGADGSPVSARAVVAQDGGRRVCVQRLGERQQMHCRAGSVPPCCRHGRRLMRRTKRKPPESLPAAFKISAVRLLISLRSQQRTERRLRGRIRLPTWRRRWRRWRRQGRSWRCGPCPSRGRCRR